MVFLYHANVKAIIVYLKLLKVKVNNTTVDETLQNHPDWPSLLCVSDSLHKWNVPNGAGKVDKEQIDELPVPFIAYTNNIETPLAIVTEVYGSQIKLYSHDYGKPQMTSKDDFFRIWDGIYVISEPHENSGES
ncbi:MAG: hypothetical protein JST86_07755 [Bacteroidetes bacterium]|nr:hypothetical protein [Bacteroidota bacterium]